MPLGLASIPLQWTRRELNTAAREVDALLAEVGA
jgi:hypothetical protein